MQLEGITANYRNMIVDSLRMNILSLQAQLIKSSIKLENNGQSTEIVKGMAVRLSDSIGPIDRLLEQIKTGTSTKAILFIDSDGKVIDLLSGEVITGQNAINQILDNAKNPTK